jgi:hypothetical protein
VSEEDARTPIERLTAPEPQDVGSRLSRRAAQRQRSLEAYLQSGDPPRWMLRIAEIDRGIANHRRRLERAHRVLRERCGEDREAFARRWRQTAATWDFAELNVLIRQHNEWYPIERQLPVDIRTRDYVLVHGRSFRRPVLDERWILEQFPA